MKCVTLFFMLAVLAGSALSYNHHRPYNYDYPRQDFGGWGHGYPHHDYHYHHHHHHDGDYFDSDSDDSGEYQPGQNQGWFGPHQWQGHGNKFPGQAQIPQQKPVQVVPPVDQSAGQDQDGTLLTRGQEEAGQAEGQGAEAGQAGQASQSTSEADRIKQCMASCSVTSEFNPVCGSNNVTYGNIGRFECARTCGVDVTLARKTSCTVAVTVTEETSEEPAKIEPQEELAPKTAPVPFIPNQEPDVSSTGNEQTATVSVAPVVETEESSEPEVPATTESVEVTQRTLIPPNIIKDIFTNVPVPAA